MEGMGRGRGGWRGGVGVRGKYEDDGDAIYHDIGVGDNVNDNDRHRC